MLISGSRLQHSFVWKVVIAVTLVGLGDLLFFQWELAGGSLGIYGLALLGGMIVARHHVRRDMRSEFWELYDLEDGRCEQRDLLYVAHQMVHSFIFVLSVHDDGHGAFFTSDVTRKPV